jgi:hypothetical protein
MSIEKFNIFLSLFIIIIIIRNLTQTVPDNKCWDLERCFQNRRHTFIEKQLRYIHDKNFNHIL